MCADTSKAVTLFESSEDIHSVIQSAFFGGEALRTENLVHAAFIHHFQKKGAGLRANLTCMTGRLLELSEDDCCCMAAAVECLHNASLVQDDMQDRSPVRRGQRCVASCFGDHVALGLTDRLITTAFACLAPISNPSKLPSVLRQLNQAVATTVDGQTSELSWTLEDIPMQTRLAAATRKSGPLFALALELPLILANEEDWVEVAHQAACQFGLGYQIVDDIKDRSADALACSPGNLVLAMEAESSPIAAQAEAAKRAQKTLREASAQARRLPHEAGLPLIEMVEILMQEVDVFCA